MLAIDIFNFLFGFHFNLLFLDNPNEKFFVDNSEENETKCPSLKVNTSGIKSTNEALSTVIHQLKWRECKGNVKLGKMDETITKFNGFTSSHLIPNAKRCIEN